jgi:hypothetical protein
MKLGPQTVSPSRRVGPWEDMNPVPVYPDARNFSPDKTGRDGSGKVGAESVVLSRRCRRTTFERRTRLSPAAQNSFRAALQLSRTRHIRSWLR